MSRNGLGSHPASNGHPSNTMPTFDRRQDAALGGLRAGGSPGAGRRVFPHIKDLQTNAQYTVKSLGSQTPIRKLLDAAETSSKRVGTDIMFKREDRAYIEYLICSELLVNVIPRHKDYITMAKDRGDWNRKYKELCSQNNELNIQMQQIYEDILKDNARSGILPQSGQARTGSVESNTVNGRAAVGKEGRPTSHRIDDSMNEKLDELFLDAPVNNHSSSSVANAPGTEPRAQAEKPSTRPKPKALQSNHVNHDPRRDSVASSTGDLLADRFSQFRVQRVGSADSQSSQPSTQTTLASSTANHGQGPSSRSSVPLGRTTSSSNIDESVSKRPSGPRDMPSSTISPARPPKIPLDRSSTSDARNLPRPPMPTYDPSKAGPNGTSFQRKQSVPGTNVPSSGRSTSYTGEQASSNGFVLPARSSSVQPQPTFLSASELLEKMRTKDVLLIDVRSREHFDSGHIMSRNIICIEPVGFKAGMSAEELDERLVNSPTEELQLFEKLEEFEEVVYYDHDTSDDSFLQGPPTHTKANHLRALHDTLFEFNDFRRLRRRPLVLLGGLMSWTELLGQHSLASSKTAAIIDKRALQRPQVPARRPLGRRPTINANSSLEVRRRRLRDLKPLSEDEERRWLEKAQREEVRPEEFQDRRSEDDGEQGIEEPPSPFVHSYEDFLRRYPEASSIQQSMMFNKPPYPNIPPISTTPSLPTVPSRPAPAVPRPSYSGVSDLESSSLSPVSRQTSASQQPIYTSRSVSLYRKLPRTGLVNFGVTCYMNSTIQCLLATIPVSQFFLGDTWRDLTRKNWKGSNGLMPGIFANLIRSLWKDDVRPIRPVSLRAFCARLKDEWGANRQQDAKEFFDFIVDCLHEDLNQNFSRTPLDPLTEKMEMVRESMPVRVAAQKEWERYSHRETSFIADLFAGQHASRLRCTTCKHTSTTYEAFYSISVEIPRQSPKHGMWDLQSCLRSYCQEEKLAGDEVWKCPFCKREREATKQIVLTRAPNFLVLHFKRFEMRRGDAKKIHTPINFPLQGLDLGPFMLPDDQVDGSAVSNSGPAMKGPYVYDAYAVLRHIGATGNGGHYVSLVRDTVRGCWRKFDDDRVEDFDPGKLKGDRTLQNEQAYLVFYSRTATR